MLQAMSVALLATQDALVAFGLTKVAMPFYSPLAGAGAPTARVVGRSVPEFMANARKLAPRAPRFSAQAVATGQAIQAVGPPGKTVVSMRPGNVDEADVAKPFRRPTSTSASPAGPVSPGQYIALSGPNPAIAAHEAGHLADAGRRMSAGAKSFRSAGGGGARQLADETAATRAAQRVVGPTASNGAGFATYLDGGPGSPREYMEKVLQRKDPVLRGNAESVRKLMPLRDRYHVPDPSGATPHAQNISNMIEGRYDRLLAQQQARYEDPAVLDHFGPRQLRTLTTRHQGVVDNLRRRFGPEMAQQTDSAVRDFVARSGRTLPR